MTSVQTAVAHEAGYAADNTTRYHAYRRNQLRKQYNQELDMPRPRSTVSLDRLQLSSDFMPIKLLSSPLSPLSAQVPLPPSSDLATPSTDEHLGKQFPPIKELFVSPHPDDICYSCFTTVSQGAAAKAGTKKQSEATVAHGDNGRVIVTVFSRSRCANGELGEKLQRNVDDITRVRKVEDEQFADTVGCNLRQLGLPDSSARDEYSRWTHLADENLQEQHRVVKGHARYDEAQKSLDAIVRWAVHCKAAIYMPMAIGCHVDHLMTRVAVTCIMDEIKAERRLIRLPIRLTYYEDLPYAYYVTEESIQRLAKTVLPASAKSHLIPVDAETWKRKQEAVMAYATQMKPIILPALHDRAVTLASLEKSQTVEESTPLRERIWTI